VGDGDDAVAAARRLVAWVHGHVAQEPSVTVPSARAVLAAGRGDCNEHAVLLTALARAAGIPARVVAGAVYANDGFYYHAWTELWLGGWISADAVFDQIPTDATHVKLMDGGPERHLALVNVIGRLAFAVEGVSS
jgi:transglutaminase-like putative cysteine protease